MSQIPKVIQDKIEMEFKMQGYRDSPVMNEIAKSKVMKLRQAAKYGFQLADPVGFYKWVDKNAVKCGDTYTITNIDEQLTLEQLYSLFLNTSHNATNNE